MYINNGRNVWALLAALLFFVIGIGFTPDAFGQRRRHHGHTPAVAQVVSATQTEVCTLRARDVSHTRRGGARALRRRNYPLCITNYAVVVSANCAEAADRYNLSFCYGANGQLRESLEELRWLQTHNQRPEDVTTEELAEAITNLETRLPRQAVTTPPVEPPTPTTTACATGFVDCDGMCRDLARDTNNCAACGRVCPNGQTCQGAVCERPRTTTVVEVRQPPPPVRTPPTVDHSTRRRVGWAFVGVGIGLAAASGTFFGLSVYNEGVGVEQRAALASNGCEGPGTSPTVCMRRRAGAPTPEELAGQQRDIAVATAVAAGASAITGAVLLIISPNAPVRPTGSVGSRAATVGIEVDF